MKNWFSKLLADTNEQGRNVFVIALIITGVSSLTIPLYIYLAIQIGAWQVYAILTAIVVFLALSAYSAALARQNRTDPALTVMLGGVYAIIPFLAAVISGLGLVLGVTQIVGILIIVRQTLSGSRAARAVGVGIATATLTVLIDQFAPWERASYPLLQTAIPYIAGVAILALIIYAFRGYRQYSLRTKLFSALGFYMIMIIFLGAIGFYYTRDLTSKFDDLANNNLEAAVLLADSQNALWQLRYGFPQFLVLENDPAAREQIVADESKWYEEINKNMAAYAAGARSPEEQEALKKWNDVFAKYTGARPRWFELVAAGKLEEAAEWRAQTTTPFGRESVATLNTLIELQREVAAQKESELSTETATAVIILAGAVVFALAAGLWIGSLIVQSLYVPINRLTQVSRQIAGGDFEAQAVIESQDEIGALAGAFNDMASRLKEALAVVTKRANELQSVSEIATIASLSTSAQNMLQTVVDETKRSYNLYHSHIYLLDEAGKNLVLTAGAGEPGRIMVTEGRSIPLDREQSLVARAAREGKGVIVNDVTQTPDFLPNPLLPDTRSELAVPMVVGGNVIGVFDIQSDQVGRFTESDINIQTTLAAQLAVSIQNVRSFERSKKQADFETMVNTIGQKIQRASSIEDTLQTAVRELGAVIGTARVQAKIDRSNGGDIAGRN